MSRTDRNSWIASIDSAAEAAAEATGTRAVERLFRKYRATSPEDLAPDHYAAVFNELILMAYDL